MKRRFLFAWLAALLTLLAVPRIFGQIGSGRIPVRIWAKATAGATPIPSYGYVSYATPQGPWFTLNNVTYEFSSFDYYTGFCVYRYLSSTAYVGGNVSIAGNFPPSSPTANDGSVVASGGATSQTFYVGMGGQNGIVYAESGRVHTLTISYSNITNGTLNITAPPQYRVILNGQERNSCALTTTVNFRLEPRGEAPVGAAGFANGNPGSRIDWRMSMGSLHNGDDAGSLRIVDAGQGPSWRALFTSGALQYESTSDEVFVFRQNNAIRQIIGNQIAVDVQTISSSVYEIRCYNPSQMGSYPLPCTFTGSPYVTYRVEQGVTPTTLKITKDTGSRQDVMTMQRSGAWPYYTWNNSTWTLVGQTPLISTFIQGAGTLQSDGTAANRSEDIKVNVGSDGRVELALARTYSQLSFGEAIATETVGSSNSVATTFGYFTDIAYPGQLGYLKSILVSDGRWEAYDYYDATLVTNYEAGRMKYRYRPYGNSPSTVTTNAAQGEVTYFEYSADPFGFKTRPTLVRTSVGGVDVAKSVTTYDSTSTTGIITATQNDYTSASAYLTTTRKFYSEGTPDALTRRKTYSLERPDGVKQSFAYQWGDWNETTFTFTPGSTMANGSVSQKAAARVAVITGTNGTAGSGYTTYDGFALSPLAVVAGKSTLEVTIRDVRALVVRTESHVWNNGWQLVSFVNFTYNNAGLLINRTASNGATYTATYSGLLKTSETDESGLITDYSYDNAGRVLTSTRRGLSSPTDDFVTHYAYDSLGNVVEEQVGWGQTEKLITTKQFDDAGRVVVEAPPGNYGVLRHTYNVTSRTHTITQADGSYTTTANNLDGTLDSKTGTAIIPEYHTYGVGTFSSGGRTLAGARWHRVDTGQQSSARYQKAWTDWTGREISSERPGYTGQAAMVEESFYDQITSPSVTALGHLLKKTKTGYAATMYSYNALGQVSSTGLDLNANGLVVASSDRITDTDTYLEEDTSTSPSRWWMRTDTKTYPVDNSTLAATTSKRKRLTDYSGNVVAESQTIDVEGNVTTETVSVNRTTRVTTKSTTRSGITGTQSEVSTNGLATSVTGFDGLTVTTYYDTLRRKWKVEDSRGSPKNTTIVAYVPGTGLVQTTTDPAGYMSAKGYDALGRTRWTRDAQNHYAYSSFTARGQLYRQWGDGTMPVEYGYDGTYGDKLTMKTYRGGTAWEGNTWPSSPGTADTTTWAYDAPSGLLTIKTDALNRATSYTYNERGQIDTREWARKLDPNNGSSPRVKTTYGYDSATGELLTQTYNDGTPSVTYQYTRAGAMGTVVDATSSSGTDKRDLVYDSTYPWRLSAEVENSFYGGRAITRLYQGSGVIGRSAGFKVGASAGSNSELEQDYGYLANGRFETVTSTRLASSGTTRTFRYGWRTDAVLLDNLSIDGGHPFTISRTYDDKRDLVTSIQTKWGSTSPGNLQTGYAYTYDERGQRSSVVQSGAVFTAEYGDVLSQQFAYDGRGQLTNALSYLGSDVTNADKQMPGRRHEYGYDTAGNRQWSNRTGVATLRDDYTTDACNQYTDRENNTVPVSGTAAADANVAVSGGSLAPVITGRQGKYWSDEIAVPNDATPAKPWKGALTVFAAKPGSPDKYVSASATAVIAAALQELRYDADGNLIFDGIWTYQWDAENRLWSMTATSEAVTAGLPNQRMEFKYDYLHRRVEKTWLVPSGANWVADSSKPARRFLYDGWNLIAEYQVGSPLVLKRSYTWGLDIVHTLEQSGGVGALLQIADHASAKAYLPAYDGNGNVVALFDADTSQNGACVAAYEYSPYGEFLRCEGAYAKSNPFRFSTKFTDDETGLVYYGRRYFSPSQGRFLGRDPKKEKGGLNLYGFCGNNGVNRWDVLGEYYEVVVDRDRIIINVPVVVNNGTNNPEILKQFIDNMSSQWSNLEVDGKTITTNVITISSAPKGTSNYNVLNIFNGPGQSKVDNGPGKMNIISLFTSAANGAPNQANLAAHELGHVLELWDQYKDVYTRTVNGQVERLLVNPRGGVPANQGWVLTGSEAIDGFRDSIMGDATKNVSEKDARMMLAGVLGAARGYLVPGKAPVPEILDELEDPEPWWWNNDEEGRKEE